MFKKTIFGSIYDKRVYSYGIRGINYAFAKKNGEVYYVFFEPLVGRSVQVDTSLVRIGKKDGPELQNLSLRDEIISNIIEFFQFSGWGVET